MADSGKTKAQLLQELADLRKQLEEQKQKEEIYDANKRELIAIYDHAPLLMLIVDNDHRIEKANRIACQFAQRKLEDILGLRGGNALRCVHVFDHPDGCGNGPACQHCGLRNTVLDTLRTGESHRQVETKLRVSTHSQPLTCLITTALVNLAEDNKVLVYIEDISQQKEAEKNLRENELLKTALGKEKELAEFKNQLMLTISHELRTPLSIISSSSEMLAHYWEKMSSQSREAKLKNIFAQITHLSKMLDDLNLTAKTNHKHLTFTPKPTNPVKLCEDAIEQIRNIVQPNQKLVFQQYGELQPVDLDANLWTQLLSNLLSNAIKYSPKGGTITVKLYGDLEDLTFQVKDEGIGIQEEDRYHLYEPFWRGGNTQGINGIGLGLTITRDIVNLHGGDITCESANGQGTIFTVTIPVKRDKVPSLP